MDAQAATALDLWLYARNAVQFVVSYPYFNLFPVLTIARNSALANSAGSDKLPNHSPNFFTAFIFPFKPFCVWVVEQVFREILTSFLGQYLGHIAKNIIAVVCCAPLKLLGTLAIVRGNGSSLRNLAFSVRSLRFVSWGYYVGTLLACEAVELLVISSAALSFNQTTQDVGVIPQQTDEATSDTDSTWVLAFFCCYCWSGWDSRFIGVVSSYCDLCASRSFTPGSNVWWGAWIKARYSVVLKVHTPSLCGKLALYYCLGMIATAGTKVFLLVINWAFNLILYLRTLDS